MKKVIFILLQACMTGALQAQVSKDSVSSMKKNELMLNFKVNNSFPSIPSGIMYRRNFRTSSLRVGLSGSYSTSYRPQLDRRQEQYSISPSIGIQKNVRLANQFYFYWGADLVYSHGESHRSDSTFERSRQSNSIGFSPLVGLRYSYKKLVLGVETAGNISYRIQDQRESSSVPGFIPDNYRRNSLDFNRSGGTKFFIGLTF